MLNMSRIGGILRTWRASLIMAAVALTACRGEGGRGYYRVADSRGNSDMLINATESKPGATPESLVQYLQSPGVSRVITIAGAVLAIGDDGAPMFLAKANERIESSGDAPTGWQYFGFNAALEELPELLASAPAPLAKQMATSLLSSEIVPFDVYTSTQHRSGHIVLTSSGREKLARLVAE